ncbi:MAG TPA: hypothetical protein VFV38_06120 [Ktedonobacteraceae bacterium]|nr:hypothetical protein [Ktedonobacteraceae bacterium]
MRIVTWILHCYPRRWRERYQEEMVALLEQHTITLITVLDLLLGACDARLKEAYRLREGYNMLQNIRDNRALSIIYICAVAIFLFSSNFWLMLGSELAFQDNAVGSTTNLLGAVGTFFIIPVVGLIALLGFVGATLGNAIRRHRWSTLAFALFCLVLASGILYQAFPFQYMLLHLPLLFQHFTDLLDALTMALLFGCGLFLVGVKGFQLLHQRQGWPLFFALLIALLLPPGTFWADRLTFPSFADFVWSVLTGFRVWIYLYTFGPYLTLSALLLTLAEGNLSQRGWRTARIFGLLWAAFLLIELIIVLVWDINRWIGGGVWIFSPAASVWPLFAGQWIGPLITNALILIIALIFALFALIRSFLSQPEGKHVLESAPV